MGFVYLDVPVGHPDFGKAKPCRCTRQELDKERQGRLLRYSNLGSLNNLTFDNMLSAGRSGSPVDQEQFNHAYKAAKAFVADPKGWLVLNGPSGCGKTHLAAAIANERLKLGHATLFQSVPDLLHHLRSSFNPESETPYDELFDRVRDVPLLILDDLGIQASTPWVKENLDQLLSHRFNAELPTVITTSTPIEDLEDRMCTRLTDPRLSHVYTIGEKASPLMEYSWGPGFELQKSMTFESFDWRRVNLLPEQRENLGTVFSESFNFSKAPEGWLVLLGVSGCGKTHLAAAIANYRYQARQPALFVVVPEFLDHLRSTFGPDSKISYDQLFESVKTTPLLMLDDFGEHSTTPWAREKLYQVINYRYNARLATVITTRSTLEEFDSPVSSRLGDMKISLVWNIIAPDYRTDLKSHRKKEHRGSRKRRYSSD